MHLQGEVWASPPGTALGSLEICGRTRAEQEGLGSGQGSGGKRQPAERQRFILPAGFVCSDPGEKAL